MPGESLGTIRGQMILDVQQAIRSYTLARQAHISTITALHTGAGAAMASGALIAGAGVAMAAGIGLAVDAAAKFEKRLDFFAAVSASTQQEFDAIRDKALQLGADTIYSANQIADSFIELGKAGVSAEQIIGGVGEAVAYLGAAADIPLDTAANIITSAVQTFGLGADQAVEVADKLAGAANASIVEVEDLGLALKYTGGVAASLGIPFEDVNSALALLGTYGIRGSTAGTSLRQILLRLSGTTPKATKALKELGIITADGTNKFFDAQGSAKPLAEIFQILQEATAHLSDEEKVAFLNTVFMNRALASAIALTKEGSAGFAEMAAAIDKTTAAEVAGKRLDNLSGDIEVLKGNIDTLLVSSGSSVQEFARGVIQSVTNIIKFFTALPDSVQGAILIFIAVTAVVLILIGTFGLLAGSILNIIALGTQLSLVFGLMKNSVIALRVAILALTVAQKIQQAVAVVATAVQWLWNVALTANPIGIIIVAIAALVAALIWFFTQTDAGRAIWEGFVNWLIGAWEAVSSFFSDLWDGIVAFFQGAIDWIVDAFFNWHPLGIIIKNWDAIVKFFEDVWNNIINGIVTFVTNAITFFQELPANILKFFQELPGKIGYAIGFILGVIVRTILAIGTWLFTNVPIIINNVITFFAELPGKIVQFFIDIYNGIQQWLTQLAIDALIWIIQTWNNIVQFFSELPGKIVQFFTDLYNGIVAWLQQLAIDAVIWVLKTYYGIIDWFQKLPENIANFFRTIVNNVVKFFTDAYNNAIQIAKNIFNGIKDAIFGLPKLVGDIFNNIIKAIKDAINAAFRAIRDFAAGLWEGFKDGLGIHSPSYIERAMWQITDTVADETKLLKKQVGTLQGLGNDITEMGTGLGFNADIAGAMAATKAATGELALRSTLGVEATQSAQLADIAAKLKAIEEKDTFNIEELTVNNPEPEPTSESLPNVVRDLTYLGG